MKPYYEHAGIRIYHGDCREVLPELAFDVLVTDPPYGVDFEGKNTRHTTRRDGGYLRMDDPCIGPAICTLALERCKRGMVFTGIRQLFRYPEPFDVGCIYCPSGAGVGRWGFTCFHPVLFYGKRPTSALYPTSLMSFATAGDWEHPCPKPTEWMRWAVKLATVEGETVLDPFAGTGTTLYAARMLNVHAIGIEIEERYCEIAAKRLSQEVLAFSPCEQEGSYADSGR